MAVGSTFIIGDYEYRVTSTSPAQVRAQVVDTKKASYGNIPKTVTYQGTTYAVTELYNCFYECKSLVTAPTIPATVTNMRCCFLRCTSLVNAPTIPSSVTDMRSCFYDCSALQTAPAIPSSVTNMLGCFMRCTSLVNAPTIPSSVTDVSSCFYGCSALQTAPAIPNSVTDMFRCFFECKSLVTAPAIPSSVTDVRSCFYDCDLLQGEVVIDAHAVSQFDGIFSGTQKGIWLTGSSSQLQALANTATNGNVFVGEIPLGGSLTAERVGSDGGTTPDPEGNWLHVVLSISWSKFSTNSLSSITIYDNNILNPVTWYTDASKTSAIILPNWRPDPTVEAHAWVHIDGDTHTIQVHLADAYHTGEPITITVPQVFRTIDFLAGGKGIAFGKIAGHEGFDCAIDALFEAGVFLGLDTTAQSGVDKEIYDALVELGWDSDVIE